MDAAAGWHVGRGQTRTDAQAHTHKVAVWFASITYGALEHKQPLRVPKVQTAAHASTCDRLAGRTVQTCTHVCMFAHLFEATLTYLCTQKCKHTKKSKPACSHTSKELPASEGSCRDRLHPRMINHITAPKINLNSTRMDTPNRTDNQVPPQTPSLSAPFQVILSHQEAFTNLKGLGQVQVVWNYIIEMWHIELVVYVNDVHNCYPLKFIALSRLKGLARLPKIGQANG